MKRLHDALLLTATAIATGVVCAVAGRGVLAGPHHWTVEGWTQLARDRGFPVAAMTAARYLAFGASGYLAAIGLITVLAIASRVDWLERLLGVMTPRLLRSALGLVSVAIFVHPIAAGAATAPTDPPVMVLVDPSTSTITATPPTMRRVETPTGTVGATTTITFEVSPVMEKPIVDAPVTVTVAQPFGPPAPRSTADTEHSAATATWTIGRGEHLWYVAEATMTRSLARAPSTREIATYWRALVDANRDRLVDRNNPDLVFTGQEFVLPGT